MKFHSISVENLNALYGRHTIDFEEDVRNAPLFLIIGKTGAGKSTLLDGVSLALFGVTPRLEQQRGDAQTDVGHIMSMGEAECSAQLEFSVRNSDGSRDLYRAKWSCRRAHGKPDGSLQRPERSLEWWNDGWQLLVSDHRNKEFEGPFKKALRGLTVEDFRRTILLAQGDFSALLHASDEEKAGILERLTSTEEYQEIGERAAKRRRRAEREYVSLKTELEQTEVLEQTERDELEAEIETVGTAVVEADEVLVVLEKELSHVREFTARQKAIEQSESDLEAAKDAFAELSDDLEVLERDRAFRHVESAFRGLGAAEQAYQEAAEKARAAEVSVGELAESLSAARKDELAAKEELERIEEKWAALDPKLESAASLEARLEPARKEKKRSAEAFEASEKALAKAQAQLDTAQKESAAAKVAAEELAQARKALADVDLDAVEARLESHESAALIPAWKRLRSFEDDVDADETQNLAALRARKTRTTNLLKEIVPELGDLDEFALGLSKQIAELRTQRDALTEATYAMETLQQREDEKSRASEKIEQLNRDVATNQTEKESAEKLRDERKARVEDLRDALRLAEQVISLSELRETLEDGDPCPLCGSPIHPYCLSDELGDADAVARRDDLRGRFEVATESVVESEGEVRRIEGTLAAKKAALQHQEGLRVEVVERLEEVTRKFTRAAEQGGFPPLEVWKLRQGTVLQDALDDARTKLEAAEAKAETLRQRRADWDRAIEELRAAEQSQADAQTKAELEQQAQESWREALAGLRERLESLDVEIGAEASWDDVAASLDAAREKLRAHRARTAKWEEAVETQKSAEAKCASLVETVGRHEEQLAASRAELKSRSEAVAEIEAELREILPEGTPAELRERRKVEKQAGREARDAAREAVQKIQSEHDQRAGRLRERQKQLEQTMERLEAARTEWKAVESGEGVSRGEVAAALLEPEIRAKLESRVDKARTAQQRALGALEAARKSFKEYNQQNGEPSRAAESLEEERVWAAQWRDAFAQRRGALDEQKRQDDRRRASVADRQEELAARREEHQRWRTIANLIGTGDGAAFRTFAQSLNLQGLVDRANVRLKHLAPRYQLAVARGEQGEPTLQFSVCDAFRAGHERPLTTLSGGETFLVSLALALALSDYRRIELPVETLLLDEGFGTLDQDALHMAVDTLQRLHQDSTRQVGIISHVEALKEMIDARIVVEKQGNGRSTIRFEVGGTPTSNATLPL